MFTFAQLQTFLDVVQTESFSAAAKRRNVSQSSISQSIKHLETRLDADLFFRQGNAVFLTRAGEEFLKHAMIITRDIERAFEAVRALRSQAKRRD